MQTAAQILAIADPEALFSSHGKVEAEFKALAKVWHPDLCVDPQAGAVLAHLNELRQAAHARHAAGAWGRRRAYLIKLETGGSRNFRYRNRAPMEIGEVMYGRTHIGWRIDKESRDLASAGLDRIIALAYPTKGFADQFKPDMPSRNIVAMSEADGGAFIVMPQDTITTVYTLADVLRAAGGKLPATAVAWMVSRLLNIGCFLQTIGMTHNGLSPTSLFISPAMHTVRLLGGWWFAEKVGDRMRAIPRFAARYLPRGAPKEATHALDRALLRAVARLALGDETGRNMDCPTPMAQFLRSAGEGCSIKDFTRWDQEILPASFGARRFVKLDIPESAIFESM